jgi:hypothetical protein
MAKLNQLVGTLSHNVREEQNSEGIREQNAERNTWIRGKASLEERRALSYLTL